MVAEFDAPAMIAAGSLPGLSAVAVVAITAGPAAVPCGSGSTTDVGEGGEGTFGGKVIGEVHETLQVPVVIVIGVD